MKDKCKFLDNDITCLKKCHYGDYCYKHRRKFLIVNDEISRTRFTGISKDYLKSDLINYAKTKMKNNSLLGLLKDLLFLEIKSHLIKIEEYDNIDIDDRIILIQSRYRGKIIRKINIKMKCNNEDDFYTFDKLRDLPRKYFYSYEEGGIRWGFDIRSLDKLIQMGFNNPYTTEPVPQLIVDDIKRCIVNLKLDPEYEDLTDTIIRDRGETIKQKTVDLFSFIEQSGYTCHVEWFTSLSVRRLKELYKQLEDLWNFRSQLSQAMKCNICPPNADIFNTPMIEVMNYNSKEDLQELILREVIKFSNANTDSDRKLGFMYFLIAFGMVSQPCYIAHIEWLGFMMN
tara:strand:- start:229 stop:1254 length:1026 start_codon:yes stop_codon:yes gene_type:complete